MELNLDADAKVRDIISAEDTTSASLVFSGGQNGTDDKPAKVLTNEAVADRAYLKKTSLYDLAVRCGIEDASGFAERFIYYERQVRADGRQNSDVQ